MIPTIWFLFPETKGRTLEEIAVVFDGPDVLQSRQVSLSKGGFHESQVSHIQDTAVRKAHV